MKISVTQAKGQLTELVRRAESGEEVILTRHGQAAVRLTPAQAPPNAESRGKIIAQVRASAARREHPGPDAARSQDFLYGGEGLPQ